MLAGCSSLSRVVAPLDIYGYKGHETRYAGAATTPESWASPLEPLDPDATTPLLQQLMPQLAKTDPDGHYRGVTYDLSTDNRLPDGWLLQTPDAWGKPASAAPFATADDRLLHAIYRVISGAQATVDIAVLAELPDGRFLDTLRDAVTALARTGRPITVRLLAGIYPTGAADPVALLNALVRDARAVPGEQLRVYVATMRSCAGEAPCHSFSWNHAKIIAVDGHVSLVGGHNMWGPDYLRRTPVHDLSMRLDGGAVASADRFLDVLWGFACAGRGQSQALAFHFDRPDIDGDCLATLALPPHAPTPGHLTVATVGRLAAGVVTDFGDQSDIATDLMLGAARHTIRLSQQDLGFSLAGIADPVWPEAVLRALADLIGKRHGDVFIVLSEPGAEAPSGNSYSTGVTLDQVARRLKAVLMERVPMSGAQADALLCRHLNLASLRFNDWDDAWPDGTLIANHAKLWVIDDRAFYIGSQNLYPVDLQELGYIVEDRAATEHVLHAYWDTLWRYSSWAAVSGEGAFRCVVRRP